MTDNIEPRVGKIVADPRRPYKAYAATALSFLCAFVAMWIADTDPFTLKDAGQAFLAGVGVAFPTGLGTYSVENPKTYRDVG